MNGLPDPRKSWAVLIGTSHVDTSHVEELSALPALPAVRDNLSGLAELLCSDHVWGLPSAQCVVVEDPVTISDMLDPIAEAADEATDTLLLYYAGHGLIDSRRGALHLALVGSDQGRIYTAVPYHHIRDALLDSRAMRRIVVLDCCYSGRALGLMSGDPVSAVADAAMAEGTYIMAAAAENEAALAPPGEKYTAFTAELLATLQQGIPDRGELLDLDAIFKHVRAVMQEKSRPFPQKRDRNTAGQLTLVRNQAWNAAGHKVAHLEITPHFESEVTFKVGPTKTRTATGEEAERLFEEFKKQPLSTSVSWSSATVQEVPFTVTGADEVHAKILPPTYSTSSSIDTGASDSDDTGASDSDTAE